jgi:catechol-2,3-dioxygenase
MLEEFHKPAGVPVRGQVQFDHVAFGVASVAELEKLQQELQRKGVEVTEIIDHGFCQSIYFTDPNGIALEASAWTEDIFDKPYHGDQQPVPAVFQDHDK